MAGRKTNFRNVPTKEYYLERIKSKFDSNLDQVIIDGLVKEEIELLENIKTISNVNEIISRMYDLEPNESKTTRVLRKLDGFGKEVAKWDVIFSSANNYDCLMHSFLTATCSNFRRLVQDDKNEFANFFRRRIFLNLPAVLCYKREERDMYEELEQRVMAKEFLEDVELFLLGAQFKVQFLSASSGRGNVGNQLFLIDFTAIKNILPAECFRNNNRNHGKIPIYCIYTNMAHYEAIRVDGEYEITEEQANVAMSTLENSKRPKKFKVTRKAPSLKKSICKACTFENPPNANVCNVCHRNLTGGNRRKRGTRRQRNTVASPP
jgi:ribosomal protein L40E